MSETPKINRTKETFEQIHDVIIAIEKAGAVYPEITGDDKTNYFLKSGNDLHLSIIGTIIVGSGLFKADLINNNENTEELLREQYQFFCTHRVIHPEWGKEYNLLAIIPDLEENFDYSREDIVNFLRVQLNKLMPEGDGDFFEVIATQTITWSFQVRATSKQQAKQIAELTSDGNFIKIDDGEMQIKSVKKAD